MRIIKRPMGYLVISLTDTFDTMDRFMSFENPLIYRLDENGNVLWAKVWKWQDHELVISDLLPNSRGNYYFVGWWWDYYRSYGDSHYNIIVGEMDTSGNPLWIRMYTSFINESVVKLINFGDKIIGITGHPLYHTACGGVIFDTNMNLIKIKMSGNINAFVRENYEIVGDTIFAPGCIIDTALTFAYEIYPIPLKVNTHHRLYEGVFYRGTLWFCRDTAPKRIPDFSHYIYTYDVTDSVSVHPYDLTPEDRVLTLTDSTNKGITVVCAQNIVSAEEGEIISVCGEYEVYDVLGRLVLKGEGSIDLKKLKRGVYMVKERGRIYKVIRR